MNDSLPTERRYFSRIPIDWEVRLICGAIEWHSQLLDLSLNGALLQRPNGFSHEMAAGCQLHLRVIEGGVLITMEGHIVHNNGENIGFYCDHIDIDSIVHLRRMVALNLGDEALLERELYELLAHHDI